MWVEITYLRSITLRATTIVKFSLRDQHSWSWGWTPTWPNPSLTWYLGNRIRVAQHLTMLDMLHSENEEPNVLVLLCEAQIL